MASAVDSSAWSSRLSATLDRFKAAHDSRDWTALRALLVDDFAFADHRPTGFGTGESAEAYVRLLQVAVDLVPDRHVEFMEPIENAPPALRRSRAGGTDGFGGVVDWTFIAVWDMRDGLLSSLDVFPADEFEAAVQCAEGRPRP
jgi:hypothetical protein